MALRRRVVLFVAVGHCLFAADTGCLGAPRLPIMPLIEAEIAAERLRPDRVAKTLSSEIDRKYVVIEVAIYSQNDATIDVQLLDFALRFGRQQETHPETPEEASAPLHETPGIKSPVQVTSETGVIVSSQRDPVTGRRTTDVGTYEATGVALGNPSPIRRLPPRGIPIPVSFKIGFKRRHCHWAKLKHSVISICALI